MFRHGTLTGIYTMLGGLLAVVWTESVQTVLLLVGAVVITVVGYLKIGGWTELAPTLASHPHPLPSVADSKVTWGTGNFLNSDSCDVGWRRFRLGDNGQATGGFGIDHVVRLDFIRPGRAVELGVVSGFIRFA